MPSASPTANSTAAPGRFPATRWSVVLHARDDRTADAQAALETLCRQYWYSLYAFARRQGRTHPEAEDATQGFFEHLLATGAITRARQERGRFRTFLLTSFRNFLINEWHRAHAVKRDRGGVALSLDFEGAEVCYRLQPTDPGLRPEQAFDRSWATGLIEQVLAELRGDYERTGRGELFHVLAPSLFENTSDEPIRGQAERLGLNAHAFTVALHRLRGRFAARLRSRVADTVADSAEVDDELRHLIAVVCG